VCIFADGLQRVKPLLIFHGKGSQNSRLKAEAARYHPGVHVKFNPKAYANEDISLWWIQHCYRWGSAFSSTQNEPRLIVLDVFEGQKTKAVLDAFKKLNAVTSFVPAGCTGYVQPLDVTINKRLKERIAELSEIHYDNHPEEYKANKYSVGDRRIMLTQWVGQAWEELHKEQSDLIQQTFRDVGLSLNPDGSEDADLKIKDLPHLVIGNWNLGAQNAWTNLSNEEIDGVDGVSNQLDMEENRSQADQDEVYLDKDALYESDDESTYILASETVDISDSELGNTISILTEASCEDSSEDSSD
jgi:hypothetical protein